MPKVESGQKQLSQTVAAHLREQIISGVIRSGEFLRIDAVAKSLNVSTTPVREGLLALQNESLVKLIPRRGFMVTGLEESDLMDMFWAQATVGAELAYRATKNISQEDLDRLEQLNLEYERALSDNDAAVMDITGHRFHKIINLAAASPRLATLMGSLTKQMSNRFYTEIEGQAQDVTDYHPLILQALRLRDANSVRSLMFQHILNGGKHLVEMLMRKRTRTHREIATSVPKTEAASKVRQLS